MKKLLIVVLLFLSLITRGQDGGLKTLTATTASSNTYTISEAIPEAYNAKERWQIIFQNGNTGAITINRAGLGAKSVRDKDGNALVSGAISVGNPFFISYSAVNGYYVCETCSASGGGTVTTVSVTTANGVSGSVANPTTTPAISLTLGAITPTTVNGVTLSGSSSPTLAVTGTTTVSGTHSGTSSGTNTGDQTITLTGAVTGSGTGSFATTIATPGTLTQSSTNSTTTAHTHAITSSNSPGAAASILATDASGHIGTTGTRIVKGWFTDLTATNAISGSITGNAATVTTNANLTGDVTSSGNATTLATVNSNVGSFGSATTSLTTTVNGKGLITAISSQTVTPAVGSITGLGTGVGTWLVTPSYTNLTAALTGTSPYLLNASGGTLTGAVTLTGTTSNTLTSRFDNLGTTITHGAGLQLNNAQAATVGSQQISPITSRIGNGWKTNATAGSQTVNIYDYVLPVQGAANPSGQLIWNADINGSTGSGSKMAFKFDSPIASLNGISLQNQAGTEFGMFQLNANVGEVRIGAAASSMSTFYGGGVEAFRVNTSGNMLFNSSSNSAKYYYVYTLVSGATALPMIRIDGGAHLNLSASTEYIAINENLSQTVQFAAGTMALNRFKYHQSGTIGFVSASTATRAVQYSIGGPVKAGTNATITTSVGLDIETRDVSGGSGVTTAYGIYSTASTGATTNYALGLSGNIDVSSGTNGSAGDAATLNVTAGDFTKDTSGSTFTLTNSFISSTSTVVLTLGTTGLTAGNQVSVAPGSGSATITFETAGVAAAPNANAKIFFIVLN